MRIIRFLISLFITVLFIFVLDRRWDINGTPIPAIARFLDPLGGFWRNIEPSHIKIPEPLPINGLQDKVSVVFDSLAIPHIFANNDLDLYFAQGYMTARHRLWQMEFLTHAASGRVSEILGPGKDNLYLDYDRGQRRLGMVYGAKRNLDALAHDQNTMIMLEKYTEGVNAYIRNLSYHNLPFEYKLLNYRPENWTPLKCMLLMKSMAQSLSMRDKDIEMSNALQLFGKEMIDKLYPDHEGVSDPIVSRPGEWNFNRRVSDSIPLALPDELIKVKKVEGPNPGNGSNNWVVAGTKTTTGSPILSGDPHLDLSLPSLWYVLQLNAPGINSLGASLPGLPGIIIGCTDSIAWTETNAQRDLVDWYRITFKDKSRGQYMLDGEWTDTRKVIEQFSLRDGSIFHDTVVYTVWGPVTYDRNFRSSDDHAGYAFRWLAHDPTEDIVAIHKMNRAKNYDDFREAISHVGCPAQNFAFASVTGDIAMHVQGKFPLRREGEGKFVLDGSKRSSGYIGFIPTRENISSTNPSRGFESSANQYPVDNTYPYYINATSWEAYRNRRINQVLSEAGKVSVSDMMKLQTDNYNLKAKENLAFMVSQLSGVNFTEQQKSMYQEVANWDFVDDPLSQGAPIFHTWFKYMMVLTWDEMDNDSIALDVPSTYLTAELMQKEPAFRFFDIQSTPERETAREIIRKAFVLAVDDIVQWKEAHQNSTARWGEYKDTFIKHLLRVEALGVHARGGGSAETLNALSRSHGPSWRMIVSLDKSGNKMWGVYPGGQSGNPGSRFYNNMTKQWLDGKYYPLTLYNSAQAASSRSLYKFEITKPGI